MRSIDGKKTVRVDNLSKLTKIEALREKLVEQFDAPAEAQRLFFRGKQVTKHIEGLRTLTITIMTRGQRCISTKAR